MVTNVIKEYIFKIKSLFANGGIEIVTPSIARTIIQPDGDVIMFVDEGVLKNPQDIQMHLSNIGRVFYFLNLFRIFFRWIPTVGIFSFGGSFVNTELSPFNNTFSIVFMVIGIVSIISTMSFYILNLYLKKKYLS